jgi:iron-sulfur cluster repair protein YtfE (RIC family)
MAINSTGADVPASRRARPDDSVDFTLMHAAHDAFRRDLQCLTAAVEAGQTAAPAVRTSWATFKNQLHVHHTAEDTWLWPPLRQQVTRPEEAAVLDAMEAEHARIEPLLSQVDALIAAPGGAGLAQTAGALAQTLAAHMRHEEDQALPLVETRLGSSGWAAFRKAVGKSQGLRGGAEFFPWMLDGASATASKQVLSVLPPPARLLCRAVWRPRYARTPRWNATSIRTTAERQAS